MLKSCAVFHCFTLLLLYVRICSLRRPWKRRTRGLSLPVDKASRFFLLFLYSFSVGENYCHFQFTSHCFYKSFVFLNPITMVYHFLRQVLLALVCQFCEFYLIYICCYHCHFEFPCVFHLIFSYLFSTSFLLYFNTTLLICQVVFYFFCLFFREF